MFTRKYIFGIAIIPGLQRMAIETRHRFSQLSADQMLVDRQP
jgi:hypothetical protein